MINNRQNGRRRGRGGQRPGGGGNPGRPESGNRIDSRARGNAGQLLEKYKALASDAQRQGDRVNTEYYLQFADHYFRVLAESRPRFDEQQQGGQRRGADSFDDDYDGDGDEFGQEGEAGTPDQFQPRGDDRPRQEARNDGRGEGRQEGRRDDRYRQDRQPERQQNERPQNERANNERPNNDRQGEPRQQEPRRDGSRDGARDGRPRYDDGHQPQEGRAPDTRRPPRDAERGAERGAGNGAADRPEALAPGAPTGDEVLTVTPPALQEASTARAADISAPVPASDLPPEPSFDVPAPRRRGRPPRVRVEEAADASPSGFDAALLPPSLSVSASAEPDTAGDGSGASEPAEKPRRRRRLASPVEAGPAS